MVLRRCVVNEETPPCLTVPAGSQELLEANLSHVPPSLLNDLERVDTVLGSVPQASPVPVRNRFGTLDEDTVLRPSRCLVLAPMDRGRVNKQDRTNLT